MNATKSIENAAPEATPLYVHLLKGVLYRDGQSLLWNDLLRLQATIREYFTRLGLELFLDETEGYAFLKQQEVEEDAPEGVEPPPRLVQRRSLNYRISLLLVLLRKRLAELDTAGGETRLILSRNEILDMVQVFLPAQTNEAKQMDQLNADINNIIKFGFLRELQGDKERLEVRRIIKALVDADWLGKLDQKLEEYRIYNADNA